MHLPEPGSVESSRKEGGKYCCGAVCFMVKVPLLAEVMTLNPSTSERERERERERREVDTQREEQR